MKNSKARLDAMAGLVAKQLRLIEADNIHDESFEIREGLQETPARVAKAMAFWFSGYEQDPAEILKTFEDGTPQHPTPVSVVNIPFNSKCEHHMADIFGGVTIMYVPNKKIVGLSKLSRLVEAYARRLQVQERMTNQIADAIAEHLDCNFVGVMVLGRHMCMESRGVCQRGQHTETSTVRYKDSEHLAGWDNAFENICANGRNRFTS